MASYTVGTVSTAPSLLPFFFFMFSICLFCSPLAFFSFLFGGYFPLLTLLPSL